MANWATLKAAINNVIKTNGNQAITGQVLQNALNNIISSIGENYQFVDIATPATNPGAPDGNVFYIAYTAGTYSNFSGIVVNLNEVVILLWRGSWVKKVIGLATAEELNTLKTALNQTKANIFYAVCGTSSATVAKVVTMANFVLSINTRFIIKMTDYNAAASPTLNVNNTGAKPLYYNGEVASADNTWEAGEVLDVYYDGTNYWANNMQGGAGAGGNQILEWNTDVATTRLQVTQRKRKPGVIISYNHPDNGWVNEQYIGSSLADTDWRNDANWEEIIGEIEFDRIVESVSEINNEIYENAKTVISPIYKKGAIGLDGVLDEDNDMYHYSNPIKLSKGQTIFVTCICSAAAAIALTDEGGLSYSVLVVGNSQDIQEYYYTAKLDNEYVSVCNRKIPTAEVSIGKGTSFSKLYVLNCIKAASPKNILFPFVLGNFNVGDGKFTDSNNTIRSPYLPLNTFQSVYSESPNIVLNVAYYNTRSFIQANKQFSQYINLDKSVDANFFVIKARYKDERDIDDIQEMSGKIIVTKSENKEITPSLFLGSLNEKGDVVSSTTRCYYRSFALLARIDILSPDIEYTTRIFDEEGNFSYTDMLWHNEKSFYLKNGAVSFRFSDDRTIENLNYFIKNIKITVIDYQYTYTGEESLTLKCVCEKNWDDGTIGICKGCLWIDAQNNMYISEKYTSEKKYIFSWPFPGKISTDGYTMALLPSMDILCIYRTERNNYGSNDSIRKNPLLIKRVNDRYELETIDFGDNFKPSGWLQNCGFLYNWKDNFFMFSEYTRPSVTKACVWKVQGDYSNPSNWKVVLEKELSGELNAGFKHFHAVQYDPYTGIIYAASGDDDTAAAIYVSKNKGETFELLYGPEEKTCRLLNFAFTKDKIYWASDSGLNDKHYLFSIKRDGEGVMDFSTTEELHKFDNIPGSVATYATVYIESLCVLIFLNRNDDYGISSVPIQYWDIIAGEFKNIIDLPIFDSQLGGFRCEYIQLYPKDESFMVGYISTVVGNANYRNNNNILGNDFSKTFVKNMRIHLGRKSDDTLSITFDTL